MEMSTDRNRRFKASGVIFDLDGTLIDNVFHLTIAWQSALRRIGLSVPCRQVSALIGMEISEFVRALDGGRITPEGSAELSAIKNEVYETIQGEVTCVAGADRLLDELREAEVPWAIATNRANSSLGSAADSLGLTSDDIVVTMEMGRAKPAADLVEMALSKMGVAKEGVVMVGDSLSDVGAAASAGIDSIGVLTGASTSRSLRKAGALGIAKSVASFELHGDSIMMSVADDDRWTDFQEGRFIDGSV